MNVIVVYLIVYFLGVLGLLLFSARLFDLNPRDDIELIVATAILWPILLGAVVVGVPLYYLWEGFRHVCIWIAELGERITG